MKIEALQSPYRWNPQKGFFKQCGDEEKYISNFCPILESVREVDGEKIFELRLHHTAGNITEASIPLRKLKRVDWFEICLQCVVNESDSEASAILKQFIRLQAAEYEGRHVQYEKYERIGWSTDVFGNAVYVFGDQWLGGNRYAMTAPSLGKYQLQRSEDAPEDAMRKFAQLLENAPGEAVIPIGYFFTGLIRELYKEAGVPVNFSLFLLGNQQNRKTTLAKLTNNLYCRESDMDFSVRTIEKTTPAAAERLISEFKDATVIFDDLSLTGDKAYRRTQEAIVEKIVRFIGNSSKKSRNSGDELKEYAPNANVIFTGEYLPNYPESTLSRMVIQEIGRPVDSEWLTEWELDPLLLSNVAYQFISWVQEGYSMYVKKIREKFFEYRNIRKKYRPYQERLQEHGFILQNTLFFLYEFLAAEGLFCPIEKNTDILHHALRRQVEIMEQRAWKAGDKDFCKTFAELYVEKELAIAEQRKDYDKDLADGFMREKNVICITPAKMCSIMRCYYKDSSITIQNITRQFRQNHFLITDKSDSSSKKVGGVRYLNINRKAVKEYFAYCCR